MVTIKKLLRNVNVCQIEGSINENTLTHPILTDAESYEGALLYIISKTGTQELDIDCSKFTSLPYAIVTSETQKMLNCHVPIIRVDSPRLAFSHACSNMYDIDYKRMKIIGITGSNGKTTTATLIHQILSDAGYRTGFIGRGVAIQKRPIRFRRSWCCSSNEPQASLGDHVREHCFSF